MTLSLIAVFGIAALGFLSFVMLRSESAGKAKERQAASRKRERDAVLANKTHIDNLRRSGGDIRERLRDKWSRD